MKLETAYEKYADMLYRLALSHLNNREDAEDAVQEAFVKYNGMECCECGCCSFVCPAKRNLTQSIKSMRKIQLAKKKK